MTVSGSLYRKICTNKAKRLPFYVSACYWLDYFLFFFLLKWEFFFTNITWIWLNISLSFFFCIYKKKTELIFYGKNEIVVKEKCEKGLRWLNSNKTKLLKFLIFVKVWLISERWKKMTKMRDGQWEKVLSAPLIKIKIQKWNDF